MFFLLINFAYFNIGNIPGLNNVETPTHARTCSIQLRILLPCTSMRKIVLSNFLYVCTAVCFKLSILKLVASVHNFSKELHADLHVDLIKIEISISRYVIFSRSC